MKKLALMVLLIAAFGSLAQAAQDTVRIFLWDNDAGETAQESPAAAMDKNYNSCYVWADNRDGNWNIYGRLWGRKPEALSKTFLVNYKAKDDRDQKAPDVAGKTGEFFFVVWQDSVYKDPYWQIYGRKIAPDGKPLSDEFRINRDVIRNAKFPRIAVNPKTQEFVVVWQDDRSGDWDVYARLFDKDCNPKSNDELIGSDKDKKHQVLPVVCASEKGIAVAWQHFSVNFPSSIYARYLKPDLSPVDTSKRVSDNVETWHITPAISASDTGYFTIAWINAFDNPYGNIFAQRFDPDAKPIDKNFQVNLSPSGVPCRIPSITMGIDNVSFWVSWADSFPTIDKYQIKARYFDYAARWEKVKLVNENPANGQRAPSVCRFGEWFSVAWLDSSRTGGRGDIFGQYYTNAIKAEQDTLKTVGINYSISSDPSAGRKIWYHPNKNYDNPATPGWNEDPIAEPDSIYIPLDSAYVRAFYERNIPNQMFVQITDTDILEYAWRKQGKLNSSEAYDICFMDLGYAEDGSTAGVIQEEQQDSLEDFATDTLSCLIVAGNDFGEMYNATTLFSYFGSKYIGPGNTAAVGNIQKIEGIAGTFTEGMSFDYPYQQAPDNSVDEIGTAASGSQLIMGSDPAKDKWIRGRGTVYSDYYKGEKASTHKNVYLTFSIGSLSNGLHPSTASELTRRILAYQGFNVEPEPIVDLVDSIYTGTIEGSVQLSWTDVSDDALTEAATKYWLKYTKYNSGVSDLGKMSSETDFIDTGFTYSQSWIPSAPKTRVTKNIFGFAPGDTLIFALKAGDESSPTRWSTLGTEPRVVAFGDTVTPHTIRLGYTYGCVNDFTKSELLETRIGTVGSRDTLFTTWDASNLYLGYSRNDWRTAGDLLLYFDTRAGGADSTVKYNGTVSAGFDVNFHPDFCLVIENGTTASLKKATGINTWVDSIASYSTSYLSLDSINKYTYLEVLVRFIDIRYTVGNVFKFLAVCQNETNDNSWNAFPTQNLTGKDSKVPAKYGRYYQFNSLSSGVSPRVVATPLAVQLSLFTAAYEQGCVNLAWRSGLEVDHDLWLIERSSDDGSNYARLAKLPGSGSGSEYSFKDNSALPGQAYLYRLGAQDNLGATEWYGPVLVNTPAAADIYSYSLKAMPNPFNSSCQIRYSTNRQERMALKVYDICGHLVKTIFDDVKQPGSYAASWTGTDDNGRTLANGVYFYRLTSGQGCLTQKITLLR